MSPSDRQADAVDHSPDGCGCTGCTGDAVAVIAHPDHGERTVCEDHVNGHPVVREVDAHV